MIDRHERERRVDHPIHHDDVELVDGVDWLPVMHGGPPRGSTSSFSSAARMTSISMTLRRSLGEQYIPPDTAKHPLLADQVEWLAALQCAYGKLAEVVDRMQARAAELPVSKAR